MIGVVIVSYKNFDGTVDFINNQLNKISLSLKVVVVDNCSDVQQGALMAAACNGICVENENERVCSNDSIFILPKAENLGFARGNNLGADFLLRNFECEYLLFTNDDILIEDTMVLDKLIECLSNREIGAVGPRVIGVDGNEQSPHHRVITPMRQLGWKFLPFLRKKKRTNSEVSGIQVPQSSHCYWISGCFFLMKTADFRAVNGFDPSTFLYAEEVILAERLKGIGKREYFCADTHVVHYGGASTQSIQSKKLKKILKESNCIYYRNYLHSNRLVILLYRMFC